MNMRQFNSREARLVKQIESLDNKAAVLEAADAASEELDGLRSRITELEGQLERLTLEFLGVPLEAPRVNVDHSVEDAAFLRSMGIDPK